jgi:NADPH2:quinone reductase
MVAKAAKSARIPDDVDFFVGSTVLHAYLTAWYALVHRARLQPSETVLVTGAAGGVGLACVEVARHLGGQVIAAVGSASKAQAVRDGGAEHVIDSSSEDVRERVKALTKGEESTSASTISAGRCF